MGHRAYEIRLFDRTLLEFEYDDALFGKEVRVVDYDDDAFDLMPLGAGITGEAVERWLETRALPANRRYADKVCLALGIAPGDLETIYQVGMGLSLNDSYWVVPKGFDGGFSDFNLFENGFSEPLSMVAYTGHVDSPGSEHGLTPELTTDGALAKAWRIAGDGTRLLYKAGTPGWDPGEPVSEALASRVASSLGMDATPYDLSEWDGKPCSVCACFCTPEVSYVPFAVATGVSDMAGAMWFCHENGLLDDFCDMLAFDALACNTDRHMTNFGFLRESRTGRLLGMAPVFDNGRSLFPNDPSLNPADFIAQSSFVRPAFGADTFEGNVARFASPRQISLFERAAEGACDAALYACGARGEAVAAFVRSRARSLAETHAQDRDELLAALSEAIRRRKPADDGRFRLDGRGAVRLSGAAPAQSPSDVAAHARLAAASARRERPERDHPRL